MLDILSDFTLQNVMIGATLLGIISGVLGTFAVLRKQSLLGDTLSHAALPGICIGFLVAGTRSLPFILTGALLAGAAAALVVVFLTRTTRLKTDASLGIALSVFFALGIVLLTMIQNQGNAAQGGLDSFLFGQAAAILRSDLYVMGAITLAAVALVTGLWKEFKLISFDPSYARTLGLPVLALEVLLTTTIALAVVVGLQTVGVILMAAMIIAPAVAARQWTNKLGVMAALSALFGVVSGLVGSVISASATGLSTGPLIVLAASVIVVTSLVFAPETGLLPTALRVRRDKFSLKSRLVLGTIYRLAAEHGDPAYPAEQAMVDTFHRTDTSAVLSRLEQRGLVRSTAHHPEPTPHWVLTPKGLEQAQTPLDQSGETH